mmetsp:Transcript_11671/g.27009  ORF Transcript_11671/g.27009 Transcript_11671/m.27009 type:complete len:83 (+) Transcript_11671:853-1101(+)
MFHDSLNRINEWGCATVFLGVVLYKIQFHLTQQTSTQLSPDESEVLITTRSRPAQQQQQQDRFVDENAGETGWPRDNEHHHR